MLVRSANTLANGLRASSLRATGLRAMSSTSAEIEMLENLMAQARMRVADEQAAKEATVNGDIDVGSRFQIQTFNAIRRVQLTRAYNRTSYSLLLVVVCVQSIGARLLSKVSICADRGSGSTSRRYDGRAARDLAALAQAEKCRGRSNGARCCAVRCGYEQYPNR